MGKGLMYYLQLYTLYSLHCVQVPHMLLTVEGDPTSARVIHATLGCAGVTGAVSVGLLEIGTGFASAAHFSSRLFFRLSSAVV